MNSENKRMLLVLVAVIAVIGVGYASLIAYTGMNTPFSVVMSQSMQHDPEKSELGCIDTGDVVVVKNKSNTRIESYVKSTNTGYKTFGDYGSVIIYERNNFNPVIHRAIVYLEWNEGNSTWTSQELADYDGEWYCRYNDGKENNPTLLRGTLVFENLTQSGKMVSVNLSNLEKRSGYLTLGDNPRTNLSFDQVAGIIGHPISFDEIKSVPIAEIPWIGATKILLGGNSANLSYVPNSLPSLAMCIVILIAAVVLVDTVLQWRTMLKKEHESDEENP